MAKQPTHLAEYAQLKREITDRVKAIAVNATYPVTGDRNYILESDGSLYMQSSHTKTPVSRWTAAQWTLFQDDCKAGLWTKLESRFGNGDR